MFIPAVIAQLEDGLSKLSIQSPIHVEFPPPEGGFFLVRASEAGTISLELSGNLNLRVPFGDEEIKFLEQSMGWKQSDETSNFELNMPEDVNEDELLGIILLSLECSFKNHVRQVSDPEYWPNFEEAQEMERRNFGRKFQALVEKRLAE